MNLQDATKIAREVVSVLMPLCTQDELGNHIIKVAGSVRRQKPDMIKDVEIVAVPSNRHLRELMEIVNKKWGEPQAGKFPSKYTKIRGRWNLDIFWCTRETFGLNFFIRTGPQHFVARALGMWKSQTKGGYSEDAILHRADGTVVPTYTEQAVFEALGWNYVRPENRV